MLLWCWISCGNSGGLRGPLDPRTETDNRSRLPLYDPREQNRNLPVDICISLFSGTTKCRTCLNVALWRRKGGYCAAFIYVTLSCAQVGPSCDTTSRGETVVTLSHDRGSEISIF